MAGDDDYESFRTDVHRTRDRVRSAKLQNISSKTERGRIKALVQEWFRSTRPKLTSVGVEEDLLGPVDDLLQRLLALANAVNRRTSHQTALNDLVVAVDALEIPYVAAIGSIEQAANASGPKMSEMETQIVRTLDALVPSAADAYRQALADLNDAARVSYRGTANELRSVLWDVLDRLAPDKDVMAAPGFKLEKDAKKPTHKQKARFVFKRRLGDSSRAAAETTVELIETRVGSLARAVYTRSSVSAHVATTLAEVRQIKMYLDSVLAELLEIHAS